MNDYYFVAEAARLEHKALTELDLRNVAEATELLKEPKHLRFRGLLAAITRRTSTNTGETVEEAPLWLLPTVWW